MTQSYPFESGSRHTPQDFFAVDWEMFGELCRALALKVAREYDPDVVVGIAKAGVIPGAVVASILRLDFYSMKISRHDFDEGERERPAVLSAAPWQLEGRRVLIVDEITTSGDTLRLALAAVRDVGPSEVRTATSFARTQGYQPDYSALTLDAQVIFPWDLKIFQDNELIVNPRYEGVIED